ncbi:MAG: hypothetical protein Q8P13_03285 [bacterium]|nr:hypothetical protein [bacterium]
MSLEGESSFEKSPLSADEKRKLEPIRDRVEKGDLGGSEDSPDKGKEKEPVGQDEERLLSLMKEKSGPNEDPEETLQTIAEFLKKERGKAGPEEPKSAEVEHSETSSFAERLQEIREKEKVKIYEDPRQDPAVQEIEREIGRLTAKYDEDRDRYHARTSDTNFDYRQDRQLAEFRTWESFTRRFPEKTQAYRDKVPQIEDAIGRIEERDQAYQEKKQKEQRAENQRQERKKIYEDPNQDPAIEQTRKEIEQKIAQRGESADSVLTGIYKKVDTERGWGNFALRYPEKATAYQDRIPEINAALSQLKTHEQEVQERHPVASGVGKESGEEQQLPQDRSESTRDLNPLDPESRVETVHQTEETRQETREADSELLKDPRISSALQELIQLYSSPQEFDARINKLKKEEPSLFLLLMKLVGDIASAGEKLSEEG